jgi:hypothetical protein
MTEIRRGTSLSDGNVRYVIPVLVYEDIPAAHDYLVRVFGFGPGRVDRDDEGQPIHAEVQAGEGVIYLHRVAPEFGVASRVSVGADTAESGSTAPAIWKDGSGPSWPPSGRRDGGRAPRPRTSPNCSFRAVHFPVRRSSQRRQPNGKEVDE